MPKDTGTVTEVGVGNIQFYIPTEVSSSEECIFDPEDEFCVRTIPDVGLLLTPKELTPTLADLIDGLDIQHDPDESLANHPLRPETDD